jgi:hypothetical protein
MRTRLISEVINPDRRQLLSGAAMGIVALGNHRARYVRAAPSQTSRREP